MQFPTSRYVSQTVLDRFREAAWWVFGVFNRYEELIALYRVEAAEMRTIVDELERRMQQRQGEGKPLENNPKIALNAIRPDAQRLYLDGRHREREDSRRGWLIEPRP